MNWFTADCHFGHGNILEYQHRPFSTTHEMNKALTENWNKCVAADDHIFHIGDFCFGNPMNYLPRLNGHIHIVEGSHDKELRKLFSAGTVQGVDAVWHGPRYDVTIEGQLVVLSHYAMRRWPKSHYGSWHLYGHSHGRLQPLGKSFDVGVDTHNFMPYSWEDVKKIMSKLPETEGTIHRNDKG